jgi:hypothetical protein
MHRDTEYPKWQQEEPNDGIKHQRRKRERPGDNEQETPQQECDHFLITALIYEKGRGDVPNAGRSFTVRVSFTLT